MALLEIVGQTCTQKNFHVGFAFLSRETEETYNWVLHQVRGWCGEQLPKVIITDRELGLLKALPYTIPEAYHMLCIWHVERNIEDNAYRKSRSASVKSDFLAHCYKLFRSQSHETYEEQLRQMHEFWGDRWGLMEYLSRTWLCHAEKIVSFMTDQHMHLGNRASSR